MSIYKKFSKSMIIFISGCIFLGSGRVYSEGSDSYGVSLVNSTAIDQTHPVEILEGKEWKAVQDAQYVKLHLYFDQPVSFQRARIESCRLNFRSAATVFLNFDERIFSMSVGADGKSLEADFGADIPARSLTINFQSNPSLCLKNLSLYNAAGEKLKLVAPVLQEAEIVPSKAPGESYNPMNMFDSRFEYAWSPVPEDKERALDFKFKNSVEMTGVVIWNGYQRSDAHCVRNGRVREMLITGDGGFEERISLKDIMEPQTVTFKKPFSGSNLKMKVVSVYKGEKFEDPVISELRFIGPSGKYMADPLAYMQGIRLKNQAGFEKNGFRKLLDRDAEGRVANKKYIFVNTPAGLNLRAQPSTESEKLTLLPDKAMLEVLGRKITRDKIGEKEGRWIHVKYEKFDGWVFDAFTKNPEKRQEGENDGAWTIRFRADGSLYLEGSSWRNEGMEGSSRSVYILGNYRPVRMQDGEMEVELFGLMRITTRVYPLGGDCNGCGRDCNLIGKEVKKGFMTDEFTEKQVVYFEPARLKKITGENGEEMYELIFVNDKPALGFARMEIQVR